MFEHFVKDALREIKTSLQGISLIVKENQEDIKLLKKGLLKLSQKSGVKAIYSEQLEEGK